MWLAFQEVVFQALKRERGHLATHMTQPANRVRKVSSPQAGMRPVSRGCPSEQEYSREKVSSPQAGTRPDSLCCSNPSPSTRATFQVYGSSMGTSLGIVILLIWIRQGCRPVDTPYLLHIGTVRLGKAH